MRPTTKMYLARSTMKRDSRGRFTSEGDGDNMRMGGGGYRMGSGGSMGGGGTQMRGGDYEPYGYVDGEDRSGRRKNAAGGSRMYGRGYTRAGNPMPNYNIPEGRDMEHGDEKTENRMHKPDDDERRIGFRTRPESSIEPYYMGGGHEKNNVVNMQRGHSSHDEPDDEEFTEETAEKWVKAMRNTDGTKGPHWTQEQTRKVMKHMGVNDVEPHEFYAVMNAMYSDYCAVAKKFGVDRPEFYGELAKAWLMDEDAVEDKAAAYYCYVVKQ